MDIKDIRAKTSADIRKLVAEKRELMRQFRFGGAGAKAKNVKEGKMIRKNIAQLLTVLNEKKSGSETSLT